MKKLFLILLVLIFPIALIGCDNIKTKNKIIISKDNNNENVFEMGVAYNIDNLKKSKYDIQVYTEEYNYGKIKEKKDLLETKIAIDDKKSSLPIGIYENEKNIRIGVDGSYLDFPLDFFNKVDNGVALSMLSNKKEIELNKELAIAIYSIEKKGESTESVNIDEDFK